MLPVSSWMQRSARTLAAPAEHARPREWVERAIRREASRDVLALSPSVKRPVTQGAERLAESIGLTQAPSGFSRDLIQRMNARIDPLGRYSVPGTKEARTAFYGALYGDAELQDRANRLLKKWVTGGNDQLAVREAFSGLLDHGGQARTPTEQVVRDLLATRKTRWERLAGQFDARVPETFHLYRGVRGDYAIEELVQALEQPGRRSIALSHHTVASWTTDPAQARRFADSPAASLIYEADIPFEKTLADKWVDGSGFLLWCPEQNEIMVAARNLEIPLDRFEATFRGKTYRAEDRAALVADWRAAHPLAPPSKQSTAPVQGHQVDLERAA